MTLYLYTYTSAINSDLIIGSVIIMYSLCKHYVLILTSTECALVKVRF